jgi:hypothetical protein
VAERLHKAFIVSDQPLEINAAEGIGDPTFLKIFCWVLESGALEVATRQLPYAGSVLIAIAYYRNRKSNMAWPKPETLARDTGLHVSSIYRALTVWQELGVLVKRTRWYERQGTKGEHRGSAYEFVFKSTKPIRRAKVADQRNSPDRDDRHAATIADRRISREQSPSRESAPYRTTKSGSEPKEPDGSGFGAKGPDDAVMFVRQMDPRDAHALKRKALAAADPDLRGLLEAYPPEHPTIARRIFKLMSEA